MSIAYQNVGGCGGICPCVHVHTVDVDHGELVFHATDGASHIQNITYSKSGVIGIAVNIGWLFIGCL